MAVKLTYLHIRKQYFEILTPIDVMTKSCSSILVDSRYFKLMG